MEEINYEYIICQKGKNMDSMKLILSDIVIVFMFDSMFNLDFSQINIDWKVRMIRNDYINWNYLNQKHDIELVVSKLKEKAEFQIKQIIVHLQIHRMEMDILMMMQDEALIFFQHLHLLFILFKLQGIFIVLLLLPSYLKIMFDCFYYLYLYFLNYYLSMHLFYFLYLSFLYFISLISILRYHINCYYQH